jgi:hypothetical protein
MSENGADAPEVVQFEPKRQPRSYDTPVEEAGQAIVAKVRRAAELANETCDRAMKLAHKLSLESQSRRRSDQSIRGRGPTLPRSRGPRRRLASNDLQRDRGKAHRSEISVRHSTTVAPLVQLGSKPLPFRKSTVPSKPT